MNVFLIGSFFGNPEEGMRKISQELRRYLARDHKLSVADTGELSSLRTWANVLTSDVDIIHYLNGPTLRSLLVLWVIRMLKGCRTIASATRPFLGPFARKCPRIVFPDLILTQSKRWKTYFESRGCRTVDIPNGVDVERFRPSEEVRGVLREKHGINQNAFVVLHTGHFKRNRNLDLFLNLQEGDSVQCVLVGSATLSDDEELKDRLRQSGCVVIDFFLANIEELYQLADCFVFPVEDSGEDEFPSSYNQVGVVDLPLSILEALSCNLPVISTRVGALPVFLQEGDGLAYFDGTVAGFHKARERLFSENQKHNGREMVLRYSWDLVAQGISRAYHWVVMPEIR